jgi:hypothetical protein
MQGAGQAQRMLAHRRRGFSQPAMRVRPTADQEHPMLHEHRQQFGIP